MANSHRMAREGQLHYQAIISDLEVFPDSELDTVVLQIFGELKFH